VSEGTKGANITDNWLPSMDRTVCLNEVCTSESKHLKAAEPVLMEQTGKEIRIQGKQNMECVQ
jgi:hypothetical protein